MNSRRLRLLLLALVPLAATAQDAPRPAAAADTAHRHLGALVRAELGASYFAASASQGGVDTKLSGTGAGLGLAVGGAVAENLILGGQVWDYVASKPKATIKGGGLNLSGVSNNSSGLVGYGVLLNWYFQPSNLYVAVTPSLTRLLTSDGSSSTTSDWGLGVRGALGKEWWITDHWGIGVSASMAVSRNKDRGAGAPTFGTTCLGLDVSATYN